MSLRAVRSPLAPKITMEQGSAGLRTSPGGGVDVSESFSVSGMGRTWPTWLKIFGAHVTTGNARRSAYVKDLDHFWRREEAHSEVSWPLAAGWILLKAK